MRKNLIQTGEKNEKDKVTIPYDWFRGSIPSNVQIGENSYIDTTFGFAAFNSRNPKAMIMGYASSCYDRATFITSGKGKIGIGNYSIINGCTLICSNQIIIGNYVMLAWGSVIYDNFLGSELSEKERAGLLIKNSNSELREMPFSSSSPVFIADNVWIGFDAIIKPGTTIGRGSVIGSKSVVSGIIPEYSVVVGNPARVIRKLEPNDKNEDL